MQRHNIKIYKVKTQTHPHRQEHQSDDNFSIASLKSRKEWNIFKSLKLNNCLPIVQHPARLSFKFDGEIRTILN